MPEAQPFASLGKGDELPEFPLNVTDGDVEAYLAATGEDPGRWAGRVPPVMLSALMLAGLLERVGVPAGVMHTGQEHEQRRGVRTGEPLTVRIAVSQHAERRGALLAAFEAAARSGDEIVATSRVSVLVPPVEGQTP